MYKPLKKKGRKKFHSNLELNEITDNKLFWKTMKSFLSDKCIQSSTITFVNKENNRIISGDFRAKFNNDFVRAVANLVIKEYESSVTDNTNSQAKDSADLAIGKYKDHSSIKMINGNVSEKDIQKEISNRNSKKGETLQRSLLCKDSHKSSSRIFKNLHHST